MEMNRRMFLGSLAAGFAAAAQTKPNIVLIVADDLGYAGISVQGEREFSTPHIDSLARDGVRFTNGYVSCPVCSPTRAGLMTGRYQQRFGHELNPGPAGEADPQFGLPLTETTIADRLRAAGYATGMVGKWHLGYRPEFHPLKRGFDFFYGFLGGAHSYLEPDRGDGNPLLRGTEKAPKEEYLTEALGREACSFIEQKAGSPFFLYLPFNAVHAPMEATAKYQDRVASIADPRRRTHAAMAIAMDDAVGRVLETLRQKKLDKDTLVIFHSDNGGPTAQTTSKNTPLRGFKGQVYEGGIRVPFLLRWPGKVKPGQVYAKPVIALDVHPTALAAAGAPVAGLDGVNLLPFLGAGNKAVPHEALYWRFGASRAIRQGDWKLLWPNGGSAELYNLATDLSETKDLANAEPDRVRDLTAAFDVWNRQLVPPKWQTLRQGAAQKKQSRKKAK